MHCGNWAAGANILYKPLDFMVVTVFLQDKVCHISLRFQSLENPYPESPLFSEEVSYLLRKQISSEHTIFNDNTLIRPHEVFEVLFANVSRSET